MTISQSLPRLLDNETYFCQFTSTFVFSVVAVGSGTSLVCNITDAIPIQNLTGLATGGWWKIIWVANMWFNFNFLCSI